MGYKSLAFTFPASYDYNSLKQVDKQVFTFVKLFSSPNASGVLTSPERTIQKGIQVTNDKLHIHLGYWW